MRSGQVLGPRFPSWGSASVWRPNAVLFFALLCLLSVAQLQAGVADLQQSAQAHATASREQTRLLRLMCLSLAKSAETRALCVQDGE